MVDSLTKYRECTQQGGGTRGQHDHSLAPFDDSEKVVVGVVVEGGVARTTVHEQVALNDGILVQEGRQLNIVCKVGQEGNNRQNARVPRARGAVALEDRALAEVEVQASGGGKMALLSFACLEHV